MPTPLMSAMYELRIVTVARVQRDAALLSVQRIAVDVDAIDDDLVRDLRQLGLRGRSVAELDDVAVALLVGGELEEQQPPVMRAGGRRSPPRVRRHDPRETRGVGRRDALVRRPAVPRPEYRSAA